MRTRFLPGLATGLVLGAGMTTALTVWAATKTYQYTGTVTQADDKTLSLDKGGEIWQFALDADSKGAGTVKKGDKATVTYRMFATKIDKK